MNETRTPVRRGGSWPTGRRIAAALAGTAIAAGSALVLAGGASAAPQAATKVTLCHATDSQTNQYVSVTVDVASAYDGHYKHDKGPIWFQGITGKWGDIIPPFTYKGHGYSLNWSTLGMTVQTNGCAFPGPAPSSSTPPPSSSAPASTPAETTPAETTPAETTPVETTPAETTPAETTPVETTPAETTPAETTPVETNPASTSASAPAESSGVAGSATSRPASQPAGVDPTSSSRAAGVQGGGGPIPAAVQAGLHAPTASPTVHVFGSILLLLGGLGGLLVGIWPARRRQH